MAVNLINVTLQMCLGEEKFRNRRLLGARFEQSNLLKSSSIFHINFERVNQILKSPNDF